jgi:hypothetical protein
MIDNKVANLHGLKVVPITTSGESQTSELESFFAQMLKEFKDAGRTKIMIISVNNEEEGSYDHAFNTLNLTSSECVGLLEITKSTVLKQMGE